IAVVLLVAVVAAGCWVPENALGKWRYYVRHPQHLVVEPVSIRAPQEGQVLTGGQPFRLRADLWLNYEVSVVEVGLWDVTTEWEHQWRVENPELATKLSVDVELIVPEEAPAGRDYRLHVVAQPAAQGSGVTGALGYSMRVSVADKAVE
ncbi:MAG: hypothetical protein M3220_04710, partial [Chloroflexota bacterium]|nr:hypothetical protein [Chloroflexota bacterium]